MRWRRDDRATQRQRSACAAPVSRPLTDAGPGRPAARPQPPRHRPQPASLCSRPAPATRAWPVGCGLAVTCCQQVSYTFTMPCYAASGIDGRMHGSCCPRLLARDAGEVQCKAGLDDAAEKPAEHALQLLGNKSKLAKATASTRCGAPTESSRAVQCVFWGKGWTTRWRFCKFRLRSRARSDCFAAR